MGSASNVKIEISQEILKKVPRKREKSIEYLNRAVDLDFMALRLEKVCLKVRLPH